MVDLDSQAVGRLGPLGQDRDSLPSGLKGQDWFCVIIARDEEKTP